MKFAVGDMVMHPRLGAGRITGQENREWVEGFEDYYVIEIFDKGLTVRLPARRMAEIGVRPIMTETKLSSVLRALARKPQALPEDANARHEEIKGRLETGQPVPIAETVRDLAWHEQAAHLTKRDSDALTQARELLVAEMALVTGDDAAEAERTIDEMVAIALASALPLDETGKGAAAVA